ncbi:hypothetical protein MSM1_21220 [Mycobacterium sp. SM1]|uniref:hypothetical protein n=1 Tax=Mycobacterium sp. SM1 TaxID=2816243 RepID=UPI001BD13A25|nr:hypothetical protein [Mycobacterium sp. SM1]MBS4730722.1 hypothetical protein [Mycobacterium sp. SM1]
MNALVAARHDIAFFAANHDLAGTGAACRTADDAVARLQHHLPSPDPWLNTALQQALGDYHVGLRYCVQGVQNRDANDIEQAATYLRQGDAGLQAAVDILQRDLSDPESRELGALTT